MSGRLAALSVAAALVAAAAGCGGEERPSAIAETDADRGARLIERYGCGACHRISGVHGADATIAPSLDGLAGRRYIAGTVPNRPGTLARWIADPKRIDPETLMPDLDVTPRQARAIAAFLYSDR